MASNYSDGRAGRPVDDLSPAPAAPEQPAAPLSAAVERFRACRWRRLPEDGPECCMHRDVLPMAGVASFKAEAWCPECEHFKARRTPRKRTERTDYW